MMVDLERKVCPLNMLTDRCRPSLEGVQPKMTEKKGVTGPV